MKKIVIGRGHDCDIIINDTTDVVSRRQAAIAFDFFGNMTIYDLSTNGTFVNGVRVPKPAGIPLKRTDSVNFGSVCDFDMSRVSDPYRNTRIILAAVVAAVVVLGAALVYYFTRDEECDAKTEAQAQETVTTIVEEPKDTVPAEVIPAQETEVKPVPEKKKTPAAKRLPKKNNEGPSRKPKKNGRENKDDISPVEEAAPTENFNVQKNK